MNKDFRIILTRSHNEVVWWFLSKIKCACGDDKKNRLKIFNSLGRLIYAFKSKIFLIMVLLEINEYIFLLGS